MIRKTSELRDLRAERFHCSPEERPELERSIGRTLKQVTDEMFHQDREDSIGLDLFDMQITRPQDAAVVARRSRDVLGILSTYLVRKCQETQRINADLTNTVSKYYGITATNALKVIASSLNRNLLVTTTTKFDIIKALKSKKYYRSPLHVLADFVFGAAGDRQLEEEENIFFHI